MVCPKQWVFVLTAVAVIFTANLIPLASLINFYYLFRIDPIDLLHDNWDSSDRTEAIG